jgi:hypothetical protein
MLNTAFAFLFVLCVYFVQTCFPMFVSSFMCLMCLLVLDVVSDKFCCCYSCVACICLRHVSDICSHFLFVLCVYCFLTCFLTCFAFFAFYIFRTSVNRYIVNGYGRFCASSADMVLNKNQQSKKPSRVGPYPSDLDGIECKTNGRTRPLVPVAAPRPETGKSISCF